MSTSLSVSEYESDSPSVQMQTDASNTLDLPEVHETAAVEYLLISNSRDLPRRMTSKLALQNRYPFLSVSKSKLPAFNNPQSSLILIWDIEEKPARLRQSIEQLRRQFNKQPLRIIGLLDRGSIRLLEHYLESGLDDWISKPLIPREFCQKLDHTAEFFDIKNRISLEHRKQLSEEESRHRWISSMAHDLRNPLVSIRGLAQFLKEGLDMTQTRESQEELLDGIADASDNLLSMVNEMSHYSSFDEQQLTPKFKTIDFYELVHNTFVLYKASASKKNMRLLFLNEDVPPPLFADSVQISRVVTNGLSNAIKYGTPGSTVTLALRSNNGHVILDIENEGKTIPEEDFGLLFKPFGKTSVRPTNGEQSTGLGLAICKKIVEAHNGSIALNNIGQQGVCFRLRLPAA